MGTTRIKVIDLSSNEGEIKASRKRAEKLAPSQNLKAGKEPHEEKTGQIADDTETNVTKNEEATQTAETEKSQQLEKETPKVLKTTAKQKNRQGANYKKALAQIEPKNYTLKEAFELLPQTSFTKFDPTVEVHLSVTEKNIKASVEMPHLKTENKAENKYLIFGDKKQLKEQQIIWGDDKTIAEIETGNMKAGKDFTVVIAAPKYMPKLAKIAKILGPKGLMPNPKNGTVTEDFEKLFDRPSAKGLQIKTDPSSPTIHTKIGKLSQKNDELEANFKALITAIGLSKIKKATLTTTMGPAIKLDTAKLIAA